MLRILIAGSALALAAPALAQETGTASSASPQPGSESATAATDAQAGASQVATVVDSEFPVYDADKSGQLDKSEFSKWLLTLKEQEMKSTGKTLPQDQLTAWASAAFTTADADKNSTVTKAELTSYLGG